MNLVTFPVKKVLRLFHRISEKVKSGSLCDRIVAGWAARNRLTCRTSIRRCCGCGGVGVREAGFGWAEGKA